jgi:hypothetical protein
MFVEANVYEIRLKPFLLITSDCVTLVRPSAWAVCQYDSWNDSTITSDKTFLRLNFYGLKPHYQPLTKIHLWTVLLSVFIRQALNMELIDRHFADTRNYISL